MWGYVRDTPRGVNLARAASEAKLKLLNEYDVCTRIGTHNKQHDTSPDLSWASSKLQGTWKVLPDSMGSDHLPIEVTFNALRRSQAPKRATYIINWDLFREALQKDQREHEQPSLTIRIQAAVGLATKTREIKVGTPTPDLHLLNLWASRLQALQRYRNNGKTLPLRVKLNCATAKAKRYTLELCRRRWRKHCTSFGVKTGLARLWGTFRGMQNRGKTRTAGQNLAIRMGLTEEELAIVAGAHFFPQPSGTNRGAPGPDIEAERPEGGAVSGRSPMDSPFTLGDIRVLGLPIDEDGGASTWLAQVTKTWRQTLGLIRRATSKSWGANECTLRMLVHALLTSKAMYGINYLRVTGAQKRKLEVLNREAMRVVTGLPRFAPIEELHKHSKINTLEDRAEIHRIAQVQRLERTRPGRAILQLLGYQLMGRPAISPPPPPWEDEAVVDHRPMKQNVDKDQKGRRNNAAKKHAESVQDVRPGSETVHVYTDAAVTEDGGGTAIAWFCLNTESKANFAFHKKHSTKEAELRAILFAVEDESLTPEGSKHLRVYTDSKEALATCRKRNSPSKTVKKIKARAKTLKSRGVKITISWVPGHAGIEGNERAHEAARELIPSPYHPATGQSAILDNPAPALIQDDSDDEEEPDWDEEATLARLERRRVLRNKLPEDDDPLPNGYGRWATVRLRRLRTGTAVSPAVRAKFERCAFKTDLEREHADDGSCRRCAAGQQATSAHLLWDCVELSRTREEAIRKLQPKLRPACLRDWIHPRGAPQHRKAILDSLLDFVATASIQDSI
ncbi:hypothetical protein ISCGN_023764 [Ixodes scapularis]